QAVKQAHDDLAQARHIAESRLDLYAGDDHLVLPLLELRGIGGDSGHTHLLGSQVAEQVRLFLAGDPDRARELDRELGPAYALLKVHSHTLPSKAALNLLGHGVGGHRLPIPPPSDDEIT